MFKVDSISHDETQLEKINKEIEEHYTTFTQNPVYAHVAFATFSTIAEASAIIASSTDNADGLRAQAAPVQVYIYILVE